MADPFEGWAILELMGHRKLAGFLSEQSIGGASFIRIDVPDATMLPQAGDGAKPFGWAVTQFYAPSAVYCITPTTEELARKVAAGAQPAPVTRYELPPAPAVSHRDERRGDLFDDDVDDD